MDFGHGAVGVEVGRRFAEYGAEVMKVESRTYTDFMRLQLGGETNPSFASSSRSKLGFGVNAKTPEGVAILHELAAKTDLVVENNSTGTMDKLGIGFDALQAVNPELVMVSSQLMGSHGAWSWWRGYGPSTQPPGGLVHLWNYADTDAPAGSTSIYPDHVAGCLGAVSSLAAVVGPGARREPGRARRGGAGRDGRRHARRPHRRRGRRPPVRWCRWATAARSARRGVSTGATARSSGPRSRAATTPTGRAWSRRWATPAWASDAALATVDGRRARADELDERIGEWTASRTKDDVAAACQARGCPRARRCSPAPSR